MQHFIYKNRWWLLLTILLSISYLLSRLTNLTSIAIFTDEAIYIRWSQIGSRDANWRLISLTDGKQPLFTWVAMALLRLLPALDPLVTGRLVSVIAGVGTAIGLWVLAYELFKNKRISFLTVFLYIISPFSLMYDRLALYDSLSACFYVWNIYMGVVLVKKLRTDIAFVLGFTLAAGMLNKTSGFLSLYLLPVTLIFFDWRHKHWKKRLLLWVSLVTLAACISQILYGVLRLSPLFHMISAKDTVFVYPFSEWITHPFQFVVGNLRGMFDWLVGYITQPLFIVSMLPLIIIWRQIKEKLLLFGYWLLPFIALALFGKVLYPRYILFMIMPLYILMSLFLSSFLNRYGKQVFGITIFLMVIFQSVWISYVLVTRPSYARIPDADRGQMLDDWPSGGGVNEVVKFFQSDAKDQKITVFTDGTFGLLPYAIEIYLVDDPNITIKGIWPVPERIPSEIEMSAQGQDTYMILNQTSDKPLWPMTEIARFQKGRRIDRTLRLYKILPPQLNHNKP